MTQTSQTTTLFEEEELNCFFFGIFAVVVVAGKAFDDENNKSARLAFFDSAAFGVVSLLPENIGHTHIVAIWGQQPMVIH